MEPCPQHAPELPTARVRYPRRWGALLLGLALFLVLLGPTVGSAGTLAGSPFAALAAEWQAWEKAPPQPGPETQIALERRFLVAAEDVLAQPEVWRQRLGEGFPLAAGLRRRLVDRLTFAVVQEGRVDLVPLLGDLRQAEPEGPSVSPPPPRMVSLQSDLQRSLLDAAQDGSLFRFRRSDGDQERPSPLRSGDLLLGGPGSAGGEGAIRDGFLRQVTGVEERSGEFLVRTEPVAFDDLLAHADGLQKAIGPADVAEATVSEVGEEGPGDDIPDGSAPSRRVAADPGTVRVLVPGDSDGTRRNGPGGVPAWWKKVERHAVFSSGVHLSYSFKGLRGTLQARLVDPVLVLKGDEISFKGKLVADTSFGLYPGKDLTFKTTLLTLRLNPVPLGFWGPVPIYVRPVIRLVIRGSLTGTVGAGGTISWEAPLKALLRKENGSWKNLSETQVKAQTKGLRLDGSVGTLDAKIFLGTDLSLHLNDVAGPTLRSGAYATISAQATLAGVGPRVRPVPLLTTFEVRGGGEVQVGGALAFLKHAELLVTVVRTEMPLYKLRYDGIELEPGRITLAPGAWYDTGTLRIWPVYQESILGEKRARMRLSTSYPGNLGCWQPGADDRGRIQAPQQPGSTTFRCHLPLLDPDLTGKEAALPVTVQKKGDPLPFLSAAVHEASRVGFGPLF